MSSQPAPPIGPTTVSCEIAQSAGLRTPASGEMARPTPLPIPAGDEMAQLAFLSGPAIILEKPTPYSAALETVSAPAA